MRRLWTSQRQRFTFEGKKKGPTCTRACVVSLVAERGLTNYHESIRAGDLQTTKLVILAVTCDLTISYDFLTPSAIEGKGDIDFTSCLRPFLSIAGLPDVRLDRHLYDV